MKTEKFYNIQIVSPLATQFKKQKIAPLAQELNEHPTNKILPPLAAKLNPIRKQHIGLAPEAQHVNNRRWSGCGTGGQRPLHAPPRRGGTTGARISNPRAGGCEPADCKSTLLSRAFESRPSGAVHMRETPSAGSASAPPAFIHVTRLRRWEGTTPRKSFPLGNTRKHIDWFYEPKDDLES